jgi:hypothetical protein
MTSKTDTEKTKAENDKTRADTATKPGDVVGGEFTVEARERERQETASSSATTDRLSRRDRGAGGVPRIADEEKPPIFVSELQRDNYYRELDERQRKREEAWREVPPGTTIRVATARGLTSRRRAGIDFSPTAVTVEVVEATTKPELEKARANGKLAVDPEGGKAILDDDGLITFRGGDAASAEAKDQQIADLEHQISALKSENARLARGDASSGEKSNPFGEKIEGKLANPTRRTPA